MRLTSRYGLPADVYSEYKKSSHAKMLESGGRTAAPSCPQCHGAHSALPPAIGEIPNVCGQCHGSVTEIVLSSPHAEAAKPGKFKLCESCHGHHAVADPQPSTLRTVCRSCHAPGSEATTVGEKVYAMLSNASERYERAVREVESLKAQASTEEMQSRLDEASTALQQLPTQQHSLSVGQLGQDTLMIQSIADEVLASVEDVRKSLAQRRLALIPLWGYVLFTVGVV